MIELVFIEILSVLTFYYTAVLMVLKVGTASEMLLVLGISSLFLLLMVGLHKKFKGFIVLSVLSLLPILYFETITSGIFFFVQTFMMVAYLISRETIEDMDIKFVVKASLYYLGISSAIFFFLGNALEVVSPSSLKVMWPFFLLFMMSSVMYLRSVRHVNGKLDHSKIRKSNIRYIIMMVAVYLVILFKDFKDEMSTITGYLKDFTGFLLSPIYYLFRNYNMDFGEKASETPIIIEHNPGGQGGEIVVEEGGELIKPLKGSEHFPTIVFAFMVALSLLIMFFVIKKLMKEKSYKADDFEPEVKETRQFIKKKKKGRLSRWLDNLASKTPTEHIRAYYRRHLRLLEKDVEILPCETTKDIEIKGHDLGYEDTRTIRDLYRASRYGLEEPSESQVETMKSKT